MSNLSAPIPVLRVFDESKAREFYVDLLEFAVDWEHRFEASTAEVRGIRTLLSCARPATSTLC